MLGPILFLLYIQDIYHYIIAETHIYVDNSKLTHHINSEDDVLTLWDDLNNAYEWALLNNIKYNDFESVVLRTTT